MRRLLLALLMLTPLAQAENQLTPWTAGPPNGEWSAPWRLADIPKLKPSARTLVEQDGKQVLRIQADAAAGGLLHPLDLPGDQPWQLSWQWRTERKLEQARFATREGDDYAARVYVLLDYPLDSLSFVTRQKLRLARTFFDPDLPAATLSYVWDNRATPGTHARSARPGGWLARRAGMASLRISSQTAGSRKKFVTPISNSLKSRFSSCEFSCKYLT